MFSKEKLKYSRKPNLVPRALSRPAPKAREKRPGDEVAVNRVISRKTRLDLVTSYRYRAFRRSNFLETMKPF